MILFLILQINQMENNMNNKMYIRFMGFSIKQIKNLLETIIAILFIYNNYENN